MSHVNKRLKVFLFLGLLVSWTCKAHATDYTFTDGYLPETNSFKAGANEAWENPINWEPEGVPGAADTVTIHGNGVPGSSVFLHTNVTVKNMNLMGVINADTSPADTNTHSRTVTGIFNWSADNKDISSPSYLGHYNLKEVDLPPGSQFNISGAGAKILECPINNYGTTTWTGTGLWFGTAPGFVFNNFGTFIASAPSFFGPNNSAIGKFNNSGTFIERGGVTTDFCSLYQGQQQLCVDFNNTGRVNVESGILSLGPGTGNGPFKISTGAELDFKGGGPYTLNDGTEFQGGGTISVQQNGNLTLNGSVTVDASLQGIHVAQYGIFTVLSGGTLNLGIATLHADNAHPPITFDPASHSVLDGALNVRLVSSDALGATDAYRMIAWGPDVTRTADFTSKSGGAFEVKDDGIYVVPSVPSPPANDNIADAQTLTGAKGAVLGNSVAATEQYPFLKAGQAEPLYGGRHGGRSIWYKWTAPYTEAVEFNSNGSAFDTLMAAYSSDPVPTYDTFLTVAGNDDSAASLSKIRFHATQGQTYYIVVDGYQRKGGLVTLNWSMPAQVTPGTVFQTLTSISPAVVHVDGVDGTGFLIVDVKGTNFTTDSRVYVNGHPITGGASTYVSPTELTASLNAAYLSSEGLVDIQVATGDQITPRRLLQVTNYAVATAPPGGTATATTPGKRNFKLLSSVEATVTNSGTEPAVLTVAEYQQLFVKQAQEAALKVRDYILAKLYGINMVSAAPGMSVNLTARVPLSSVPGKALPLLAGIALGPGVRLISPDHSPLIGQDGGTLIGQDGGTIVGQCGGCFLSNDGATLIGQDGGTIVAQGGGNLAGRGGGPLQSEPPTVWTVVRGSGGKLPLITNAVDPDDGSPVGALSVTFDDTSTPKVTELTSRLFMIVMPKYGDLNGDGAINVQDAIVGLKAAVGLATLDNLQLLNGDVAPAPGTGINNGAAFGDGKLTVSDVVKLLRVSVGLDPGFG